mmetsp:Transcript_16155/g.48392  ORF Transcript_16155/g.48392 Transcript_16155/m.48392 type:complete len:201 (+) Transcript_16155:320-922(+)
MFASAMEAPVLVLLPHCDCCCQVRVQAGRRPLADDQNPATAELGGLRRHCTWAAAVYADRADGADASAGAAMPAGKHCIAVQDGEQDYAVASAGNHPLASADPILAAVVQRQGVQELSRKTPCAGAGCVGAAAAAAVDAIAIADAAATAAAAGFALFAAAPDCLLTPRSEQWQCDAAAVLHSWAALSDSESDLGVAASQL